MWLFCFFIGLAAGAAAGAWTFRWTSAPRRRRKIVLRCAGVLTALALVPAVVPYDHLLPSSHIEELAAHAAHCHESPAACADAPVTSGPGQMIDSAPLLAEPGMLAVLLLTATPLLVGLTRRPVLRPPVLTLAAST
jgi:hypothetical protein